jgi:hypothetical protein
MYKRFTAFRQCTCKGNIEVRLRNNFCRGIPVSITYSKHMFVTLIIPHEMRKHRIIAPSLACLSLPHFFTLPHKWHVFQKHFI